MAEGTVCRGLWANPDYSTEQKRALFDFAGAIDRLMRAHGVDCITWSLIGGHYECHFPADCQPEALAAGEVLMVAIKRQSDG